MATNYLTDRAKVVSAQARAIYEAWRSVNTGEAGTIRTEALKLETAANIAAKSASPELAGVWFTNAQETTRELVELLKSATDRLQDKQLTKQEITAMAETGQPFSDLRDALQTWDGYDARGQSGEKMIGQHRETNVNQRDTPPPDVGQRDEGKNIDDGGIDDGGIDDGGIDDGGIDDGGIEGG